MSKDRKRHKKALERRVGERRPEERPGARLGAAMAEALADPARFAEALRRFSTRALLTPGLAPFRLPRRPLLLAVLDAPTGAGSDEERRRALRQGVLPRFASPTLLHELSAVLRRAHREVEDEEDLQGLLAASAMASACAEAGAGPDQTFWELVYDLTLTDALLSGELVTEVALRALVPDEGAAAQAFARALAQGELGRELLALGLDEQDPARLAAAWAEAANDRDGYHVQFDATLHLLLAQTELAMGDVGAGLLRAGLDDAARRTIVARCALAFDEDITATAQDELVRWARVRLASLRDDAPATDAHAVLAQERLRCGVLLLSLLTLPREQNALLRATHLRGLVRARRYSTELEVPFVHRISADPEDVFALDDYELLLTELGETPRARRVRRYRDAVKHRAPAAPAPAAQAAT